MQRIPGPGRAPVLLIAPTPRTGNRHRAAAPLRALWAIGMAAVVGAAGCATVPAPPRPAPAHVGTAADDDGDAGGAMRAPIARTVVGPPRGALVVAGGGALGPEVMSRFIELAGGASARIVILPGAGTDEHFPATWSGFRVFRDAGVSDVRVLHTRDRAVADTDAFAEPLRSATGVWIPGGRQWRLVDSYLDTRTLAELHAVLDRGGVIGGTSAGASVQASYMVRGAVEGNTIMMAPGYEQGFAFLRNTAVDQHLLARGRQDDMLDVIARHPTLLGVGLDEGTAIVVTGDRAEVVGRSKVAFYNTADAGDARYYFLRPGDVFDLAGRRTLRGSPVPSWQVRAETEALALVERLFDAMRAQDTAAIRAISHPELRIFVPGEQNGTHSVRVSTLQQFMQSIAAATELLDERAYDPEVRVDGNLASVWTGYDFIRGGQFSHCGTDAFHLARGEAGAWQIIGLAYTIQREACPQRR